MTKASHGATSFERSPPMADKTHGPLRSAPLDDETLLGLLSATRSETARVAGPHLSSEQIVDLAAGSLSEDEAAKADVHLAFCEECHTLAYWLEHDNFGSTGNADGLADLTDSSADETASEGRVIRFPLRELQRLGASSTDVPMRVAAADPAAAGSYSETSVHGARTITVSIDAKDEVIVSVEEHERPVSGAQVAVGFAGNQLARVIPTKDGTTDDDGEVSLGPLTSFRPPPLGERYQVTVEYPRLLEK